MPSLPPLTYHQYFPFGITDIDHSWKSIAAHLRSFVVQCLCFNLVWILANYMLSMIHSKYASSHLHSIFIMDELYAFIIPYSLFLYILYFILFACAFIPTMAWSILLCYAIHLTLHTASCGIHIWFMRLISFSITLIALTSSFFFIHIHANTRASRCIRAMLCCQCRDCNQKRRLQSQQLETPLLSSEIMSEMDVGNDRELKIRFLDDDDVLEYTDDGGAFNMETMGCDEEDDDELVEALNTDHGVSTSHTHAYGQHCLQTICQCVRCVWCYHKYNDWSLQHRFLALLCLLVVSLTICIAYFTFLNDTMFSVFSVAHLRRYYWLILALHLGVWCGLRKWLKCVAVNMDNIRLDSLQFDHRSNKSRYTATETQDLSINFQRIQNEINALQFEISLEVAMEIWLQISYYATYANYAFARYTPAWWQFAIVQSAHCLVLFVWYGVRMHASYYKLPIWENTEMEMMQLQSTELGQAYMMSTLSNNGHHARMSSFKPLKSIPENGKDVCTEFDDVVDVDMDARARVRSTRSWVSMERTPSVPRPPFYMLKTKTQSATPMDVHSLRFTDYEQWRNRLSVDAVIRLGAMWLSLCTSYLALLVRFYLVDGESGEIQLKQSTIYFAILVGTESMVFGCLYCYLCRNNSEEKRNRMRNSQLKTSLFNMFYPVTCLYAKCKYKYGYVLLFVVGSSWMFSMKL